MILLLGLVEGAGDLSDGDAPPRCRCRAGGWIGLGWDMGGMVVGNACIATMAPSAWDLSPVGRTGECCYRDGLGGYHVAL